MATTPPPAKKPSAPPAEESQKDVIPGLNPHPHAMSEAAVLSGAVAGAIVGAVAGPVGAIAGGAIGSAIGAIAGVAMEREEHLREEHDRVLDDEIGVTSGSLGSSPDDRKASPEVLREARESDRPAGD
ncbi:MAG TPA: hypothetical protein PLR99_22645 [Polyangiaceae bacterium]|jgi:hypothetical protein|nr:hypothetical protein [Polyangiaceae bacterium]